MKKVIKLFIVIGLVFFSIFFIDSFSRLLLFNELGDFFNFNELPVENYIISGEEEGSINVDYSFAINEKEYKNSKIVFKEKFYRDVLKDNSVIVMYNTTFPKINYLKGLKTSNVYFITGGIFFMFLCLFIFGLKRVNIDEWLGKYKKVLIGHNKDESK